MNREMELTVSEHLFWVRHCCFSFIIFPPLPSKYLFIIPIFELGTLSPRE